MTFSSEAQVFEIKTNPKLKGILKNNKNKDPVKKPAAARQQTTFLKDQKEETVTKPAKPSKPAIVR